jgi:hypothetical protein
MDQSRCAPRPRRKVGAMGSPDGELRGTGLALGAGEVQGRSQRHFDHVPYEHAAGAPLDREPAHVCAASIAIRPAAVEGHDVVALRTIGSAERVAEGEFPDLAFVVHRAPQVHAPSADAADHLVQMPARGGRRAPALPVACDLRAELDRPTADGLAADLNAARRQQLLHISQAQREAEIEPDRLADNVRREPVTLALDRQHPAHTCDRA